MGNIQPKQLLSRKDLLHLESESVKIATPKIVANDKTAPIQILAKVCNFLRSQRQVPRFGDVYPGIIEDIRAVQLHHLVGFARRMGTGKFVEESQKEIFREWIVV